MHISKHVKNYTVKSHEVDCHGFLRLLSLMNILQDIAVEHADTLGVGLDICKEHMGKSKRYLTHDHNAARYNAEWKLVVPENILQIKNGEVEADATI